MAKEIAAPCVTHARWMCHPRVTGAQRSFREQTERSGEEQAADHNEQKSQQPMHAGYVVHLEG